jgi:NAD(P)-dependent dehydrogenase (short-subunit alcohol dehydrogenase family)
MKNSVAIVTGANQGIGRSTAVRLARDFSAVVLAARNAKALEEVAAAVRQSGAQPQQSPIPMSPAQLCFLPWVRQTRCSRSPGD